MSRHLAARGHKRLLCLFALGAVLGTTTGAWSKPTGNKKASASRGTTSGEQLHEVRTGQTLGGIALRYHVSVAELCRANGIAREKPIRPGQKLLIPGHQATPPKPPAQTKQPDRDANASVRSQPRPSNETKPSRSKSSDESGWLAYTRPAPKAGYVTLHSTVGSWSGYAIFKGDVLSPYARSGFRRVLASWRTGKQVDIPERLIRLLVQVSDTFGGRSLRIVGGYREHSYAKASKHKLGHAVDFSVDGVPNEALRDYLRTLPNVGVGFYPNSSFVHLDVRPGRAYWIDYSQPGKPPVYPSDLSADRHQPEQPEALPGSLLTAQLDPLR